MSGDTTKVVGGAESVIGRGGPLFLDADAWEEVATARRLLVAEFSRAAARNYALKWRDLVSSLPALGARICVTKRDPVGLAAGFPWMQTLATRPVVVGFDYVFEFSMAMTAYALALFRHVLDRQSPPGVISVDTDAVVSGMPIPGRGSRTPGALTHVIDATRQTLLSLECVLAFRQSTLAAMGRHGDEHVDDAGLSVLLTLTRAWLEVCTAEQLLLAEGVDGDVPLTWYARYLMESGRCTQFMDPGDVMAGSIKYAGAHAVLASKLCDRARAAWDVVPKPRAPWLDAVLTMITRRVTTACFLCAAWMKRHLYAIGMLPSPVPAALRLAVCGFEPSLGDSPLLECIDPIVAACSAREHAELQAETASLGGCSSPGVQLRVKAAAPVAWFELGVQGYDAVALEGVVKVPFPVFVAEVAADARRLGCAAQMDFGGSF